MTNSFCEKDKFVLMVDDFLRVGASSGLEDFVDLSSFADPWQFGPDPDPTPDPAIFVSGLQDSNKNFFFASYFLKLHLHLFQRLKVIKKSQNIKNQGFLTIFAWC